MTKRLKFWPALAALLSPLLASATDATWVNNGTITLAPQIDATNVVNYGTINIFTTAPFDTSNTRNFTNYGSMSGTVGYRFDRAPRNSNGQLIGQRVPADNFYNGANAVVSATDGFGSPSKLLIEATNIFNLGALSVGAGGGMELVGETVKLTGSRVGVNAIIPTGSTNGRTNFTPDVAITDNYWGQSNDVYNTAAIATDFLGFLLVDTPPHEAFDGGPFATVQDLTTFLLDPIAANFTNVVAAYTNALNETNLYVQAVFLNLGSTNMGAEIRFSPSPILTNLFRGVGIQLYSVESNVISETAVTNYLYFSDTLASRTNRGLLLNTVTRSTARPANYVLSRLPVPEFDGGQPGNTPFTPDLLFFPELDVVVSEGPYAAYSASIDNLGSRPPPVPSGDYTNNPGRIEIRAKQLDLRRTRFRAEGLLDIQTDHLINSSNAVVDSENLSYNLASTNGTLRVQNLMKESVSRTRGTVSAWSALWTNSYSVVVQADTNQVTNLVSMKFHVLALDASLLQDTLPVSVYNLTAKATNVIVSDNAILPRTLRFECDALTLNGNLTLTDSLTAWGDVTAPGLDYFTNSGVLSVPNEASFGADRITPYETFVNTGSISSFGQAIWSKTALLSGAHNATAAFSLTTTNGQLDAAIIQAGNAVTLAGDVIRLNQATVFSGTALTLNVTNSLRDDGGSSSNIISVRDGFSLPFKPATGDLLGTTVTSTVPTYAETYHVWAGTNAGVSASGFSNNVALGRLVLTAEVPEPLFVFRGAQATETNGLYVDLLDLSQLTDFTSQLVVEPSLIIYYAAAALNASPTNGQSNEEFLDGQLGGRLRWVSGFAGPNSTTNVTINGNQTISVNAVLRNSTSLDSDADGIMNGSDALPFDGVVIDSIKFNATPAGYQLTWDAAPNTVYQVEARTNLLQGNWTVVVATTPTNSVVAPWTVVDTNLTPAGVPRYYRVTYNPNY